MTSWSRHAGQAKLQLKIDSMLPHNIMDHQHPLRYYDDHHQNYTHHLQFKNSTCHIHEPTFCLIYTNNYFGLVSVSVDIVKVDALARQKNSKRHFLKDIENSFHQVTHTGRAGLEPHHFFLFKISQQIQSLETS